MEPRDLSGVVFSFNSLCNGVQIGRTEELREREPWFNLFKSAFFCQKLGVKGHEPFWGQVYIPAGTALTEAQKKLADLVNLR